MTTMLKGVIKYFDSDRGFGFVKDADGVDYFFHFTAFHDGADRDDLVKGQHVCFTLGTDKAGRMKIGRLELAPE